MAMKQAVLDLGAFNYDENGIIPVVVQDYESGEVLMLASMNAEAVEKTFETGYAHYVVNGAVEKFGGVNNTQTLKTAFLNNGGTQLLIKVKQKGMANAENKAFTCFPTQIKGEYNEIGGEMFGRLQRIIKQYRQNPEDGAYTSFLFARGVDRIGKKVGEEAVELVIAAKNTEKIGVINEAADPLYHVMVLLNAKDVKISEVCNELCKRNR